MDEALQRAWATVVEHLGLDVGVENGALVWRGRVGGEQLVVRVDERGDITLVARGDAPPEARLLASPRSVFLCPAQALVTGDRELDAAVAIVDEDGWARARLDAETRRLLCAIVGAGGGARPGEVRLGPRSPDGFGQDEAAIEATLRDLSALAARLRRRSPGPVVALTRVASDDPLEEVRAAARSLLDAPEHVVAVIDAAGDDDEGLARLAKLSRAATDGDDRERALRRLLLLFDVEVIADAILAYPGPWSPSLAAAVVGALHPRVPLEVFERLGEHDVVGPTVRLWAISNAGAPATPETLTALVGADDEEVRRGALDVCFAKLDLDALAAVVPRSRGPFLPQDLHRLRELLLTDEPGRHYDLLHHLARHLDDGAPSAGVAMSRLIGATRDARALPWLKQLAAGDQRREPWAPLVAAWACGASFEELLAVTPRLAPREMMAEVAAQAPPRVGPLLAELLVHADPREKDAQLALLDVLARQRDETAVPALFRFVETGYFDEPLGRALQLIGELGGLADIEPLEPYTRGFFRQVIVKEAAAGAIERIAERLAPDAVAGSLSLSADPAGDLTLASSDET